MVDLIPEGFLSLTEVYDRYRAELWNGGNPTQDMEDRARFNHLPAETIREHRQRLDELRQQEWQELVGYFVSGRLEAFVQQQISQQRFRIPPTAWEDMFFPERVFLSDQVVPGLGEYWDELAGRTPFVEAVRCDGLFGEETATIVQLMKPRSRLYYKLRDLLIGLAMDGVYSPTEVEEMGKRWGLQPFSQRPSASRFDPTTATSWSLPMVLAWIVWRTPEAVREQWDAYRSECYGWCSQHRRLPLDGGAEWYEVDGSELRQLGPASVATLSLLEAINEDPEEATKIVSVKTAREDLWHRLSRGYVIATGIDPSGSITSIESQEWAYLELAHGRQDTDYLINRHKSLEPAYTHLAFDSASILEQWKPQKNKRELPVEQVRFSHDEKYWNFFEACLWVGCEGQELGSNEIVSGDLDTAGAAKLFKALNEGLLPASGIAANKLREDIPAEYWELASLDPETEGHYLSFVDDAAEGFWGTLTPAGEDTPRWNRINIEARPLKRIFPFGKSQWKSCQSWLEDIMRDSPKKRPRTKDALRQESSARFKTTKADFDRAWRGALENVPEAKPFWTAGGRPKNPSE